MSLYNNNRPLLTSEKSSSIKIKKKSEQVFSSVEPSAAAIVQFINATPADSEGYSYSLSYLLDDISVSNLESISDGSPKPFYVGTPYSPVPELGLTEDQTANFYECYDTTCGSPFLFANLVSKRNNLSGFYTVPPSPLDNVPSSPRSRDVVPSDYTSAYERMGVDQGIINDSIIKVDGMVVENQSFGVGVPVIKQVTLDIDTWYDGTVEQFDKGNNTFAGYTNDVDSSWELGERNNWSFGTVFFTSNISSSLDSDCIDQKVTVSGDSTDSLDMTAMGAEVKALYTIRDINLIGWVYVVSNASNDNNPYIDHTVEYDPENIGIVHKTNTEYIDKEHGQSIVNYDLIKLSAGDGISIEVDSNNNIIISDML